MLKYEGQVIDQLGQPVKNVTVTVYRTGSGSLAPLYSSDSVSSSLVNPLTTDATGYFAFFTIDGIYDIAISGTTLTTTTHTSIEIADGLGTSSVNDAPWNIYTVATTVFDIVGLDVAPSLSAVDYGRLYYDKGTNKIKYSQDGSAFADLAGGTAHNMLSTTHSDSTSASAVLGDVIYADASQKWTRLAGNTTTTKKFMTQTGNGSVSAVPAWGTIIHGDAPTSLRQFELVFHAGQSTTWTAQPAGLTEFLGVAYHRMSLDLTGYTQFRLLMGISTNGFGGATMRVQYSTDSGSNWNYIETGGGTTHEVAITTSSPKVGAWTNLDTGATGEVYIRTAGIGGDATVAPVFRYVKVMFR